MNINKPYLIIPKLIQQPTWGGSYIAEEKGWSKRNELKNMKIGQSYELYGNTLLSLSESDSMSQSFGPELKGTPYNNPHQTVGIGALIEENGKEVLGESVYDIFHRMPILIKFTQALGNSFQLHVKTGTDTTWKPKPESWYFLEDGTITLGLDISTSVVDYKKTSLLIDQKMHELSARVIGHTLSLEDAREQAGECISFHNPWQYVNRTRTKKYSCIDLSGGGIHHSWEEDSAHPIGNIVYEVQSDVSDDESTLRSFDQGKIKDDGTVRTLTIEEYFTYIDADPAHNILTELMKQPADGHLFRTPYYTMDILDVTDHMTCNLGESFDHVFVQDGDVTVSSAGGSVHMTRGHSCFIPWACHEYEIQSTHGTSQILKTYIGAGI